MPYKASSLDRISDNLPLCSSSHSVGQMPKPGKTPCGVHLYDGELLRLEKSLQFDLQEVKDYIKTFCDIGEKMFLEVQPEAQIAGEEVLAYCRELASKPDGHFNLVIKDTYKAEAACVGAGLGTLAGAAVGSMIFLTTEVAPIVIGGLAFPPVAVIVLPAGVLGLVIGGIVGFGVGSCIKRRHIVLEVHRAKGRVLLELSSYHTVGDA